VGKLDELEGFLFFCPSPFPYALLLPLPLWDMLSSTNLSLGLMAGDGAFGVGNAAFDRRMSTYLLFSIRCRPRGRHHWDPAF